MHGYTITTTPTCHKSSLSPRTPSSPATPSYRTGARTPDPEVEPEIKELEDIINTASKYEPGRAAEVERQGPHHHQVRSPVQRAGARPEGAVSAGINSRTSCLTRSAAKKRGQEDDYTENTPASKKTKEGFKKHLEEGGNQKCPNFNLGILKTEGGGLYFLKMLPISII